MPDFTTAINMILKVIPESSGKKKVLKVLQIGKEESKLSLFANDVILHAGEPKDFTKKLLELLRESGKAAQYKINTQHSVFFLYPHMPEPRKHL